MSAATKTITVTLDGQLVKIPVGQLPDTVYATALQVLRERMELVRDLAKIYVHVDTGALRDSIRLEWLGAGRRVGTVRAGGYVTNPRTGRLVDYAAAVEQKYPYMRPAAEAGFNEVETAIKSRVFDAI